MGACEQQCRSKYRTGTPELAECLAACGGQDDTGSGEKALACINGKCVYRLKSNPNITEAQFQACAGKSHGDSCIEGGGDDHDFTEKQKCKQKCNEAYHGEPNRLAVCLEGCEGEFPKPPEGEKVLACVTVEDGSNKCRMVLKSSVSQAQISACEGKNASADCQEGGGVTPGTEECPKGNYYAAKGPGDCVTGYVWVKRAGKGWEDYEEGMGGRCECSAWCEQHGYEADCKTKKGEMDGGETWKPSGDLQAIIQRLLDRMNELFDYETGLRDEEYNMLLNRLRTNVKAGERGRMESLEDRLGSMGLLGTGMELEEYGKEGRKTRQLLADVESQVALDEALRRYDQFLGTTGAARSLFGTVLGVEQLEEVLNAARRGEGRQDMSMLLTLLTSMMGAEAQNPYWQAIINSMLSQGSSQGSDYSWINWLPWLLG